MFVRRSLIVGAAAVAALGFAAGGARVVAACDQNSCLPQLTAATPQQVVLGAKPVHVTLSGVNLGGVTGVLLSPVVPSVGFIVFNETTILVSLPATTPSGIYSVRVISPDGGSDPSFAPQIEVFPAPLPSVAPTPTPKPTPVPRPTPTPKPPLPDSGIIFVGNHNAPPPSTGLMQPTGIVVPAPSSPSAALDVIIGLALGVVGYMLWGTPRRLAGTWRSAPLAHLIGRPAQALHVGQICLYCGRLHFVWATRRDLWKERRYCGPRCFISAEAMSAPLVETAETPEADPERLPGYAKHAWWHAAVSAADAGAGDHYDRPGATPEWRPRY